MKMKTKKTKKDFSDKKIFVVHVGVYRTDIVFCINSSRAEIIEWFKKNAKASLKKTELDGFHETETNEGRMIQISGGFLVLLKVKKDYFREFVGNLVHEATHVSHYLLRDRRIPLIEDTEEAYTYLVQHIVVQALLESYD